MNPEKRTITIKWNEIDIGKLESKLSCFGLDNLDQHPELIGHANETNGVTFGELMEILNNG